MRGHREQRSKSNGMHTYRFGYNGAHRRGAGRGGNGPPGHGARHGSRRDVGAGLRGVTPRRGRSRTGRNEQQVGAWCRGLYGGRATTGSG